MCECAEPEPCEICLKFVNVGEYQGCHICSKCLKGAFYETSSSKRR